MVSQPRARYLPRPTKGDERREQLLAALRERLEVKALEEIGVAEITTAAGVTRSAFYFYFPTKASAVAAMLAELREQIFEAGKAWYGGGTGEPALRVRTAVDGSVELWRAQPGLMAAMLDAAAQDLEVRQAWQSWVAEFVERIVARIEHDRDAGLIRATSQSRALATVLMGATLHSMEQEVRSIVAGQGPLVDLPNALSELWYRTLYI